MREEEEEKLKQKTNKNTKQNRTIEGENGDSACLDFLVEFAADDGPSFACLVLWCGLSFVTIDPGPVPWLWQTRTEPEEDGETGTQGCMVQYTLYKWAYLICGFGRAARTLERDLAGSVVSHSFGLARTSSAMTLLTPSFPMINSMLLAQVPSSSHGPTSTQNKQKTGLVFTGWNTGVLAVFVGVLASS